MTHFKIRDDAVWHQGRRLVPTIYNTVWVATWAQFKAVGGVQHYNEDQTEIVLTLPVGHKFAISFQRE